MMMTRRLLAIHHHFIRSSFNKNNTRTYCSSILSSPWMMLPPSSTKYNFYIPAENKLLSLTKKTPDEESEYQIVGSSHGWLALLNSDNNFDLFLSNPVTRRHVKLPSIQSLDIPEEKKHLGLIKKLIISCDDPQSPECRALMIYGPTLFFCSPLTSTHWTILGNRWLFVDNVYKRNDEFVYDPTRKLFYCIAHDEIKGWDLFSDPQNPGIEWASHDDDATNTNLLTDNLPRGFHWASQFIYLIPYSDQLFLVCRDYVAEMAPDGSEVQRSELGDDYPYKTVGFRVYRIDREGQKMSYMEEDGNSLDGLVMFVGLNHSFALSASEHPGLKPNAIYFADPHIKTPPLFVDSTPPKFVESAYGGHDIGIFDYENKTISPCYYPCDVPSFKRITPTPLWFTPTFNSLSS